MPISNIPRKRAFFLAILACIFFFAAGRVFQPHLGLETDEALFSSGIYAPAFYTVKLFGRSVPLMLSSYIGTLKSLIYTLVFKFCTPTASSTRVPMLFVGILTIWLFHLLLLRLSGERAALLGIWLLATDVNFLLTTVFDWGPVALQHLLVVAGILLLHKYYERPRVLVSSVAFFLFGLALWDKAVFVWSLVGLAAASAATFPRELIRLLTPRHVGLAGLAFCLGALPLIVYNADKPLDTFRSNTSLSFSNMTNKANFLGNTLSGEGLIGWMIRQTAEPGIPSAPRTRLQHGSAWLNERIGHTRSLLVPALTVSMVLLPVLWRLGEPTVRAAWFGLVFMAVVWLQMALGRDTGGSVHHTILLWPFPQMVVAVTAAAASRRWKRYGGRAVVVLALVMIGANLVTLNRHYAVMIRNGGGVPWTDAINELAVFIQRAKPSHAMVIDWGMVDSVLLLSDGQAPLRNGMDPLAKNSLDEQDRERVRQWLLLPGVIFVSHSDGNEQFAGVNARLQEVAGAHSFAREILARIRDRNGREIFLVFRYQPRS